MELHQVPLLLDAQLRVFRTTADPALEEQTVPFSIGNPALLVAAWMVGRKHDERDRPELTFQLRVPFMARRAVAPSAQRHRRALPSAQTLGDHVLPALRLTNEVRLAKDALSHGSVSRQGSAFVDSGPNAGACTARMREVLQLERVRFHHGPARTGGAGAAPPRVREHGDGAAGWPVEADRSTEDAERHGRRGRRARPLRRQPERQDYLQGGEAARDRASPPVAPRLPVHAGRRWGRSRVRVKDQTTGRDLKQMRNQPLHRGHAKG